MYDNITPEQWVIGLVISLLAFGGLVWLLWRAFPARDDGADDHMSSRDNRATAASGTQVVHVPVLRTSTAVSTSHAKATGTDGALPDTDALEAGTDAPRLSLRLSDEETIALLAAQRGKDGKYRYSANQIHGLVGGSRADVLARVRVIRDGAPAVFPPLSPEQQQLRQQLQLDQQ